MQTRTRKACKVCSKEFEAWSTYQRINRFCGPVCAAKWGEYQRDKKRAAAFRAETRRKREALKTTGDYVKEAQKAFNQFIRARDYAKPCISCGAISADRFGGGVDCGHYRSTGAAPHLRFNTFNAAAQCKRCNRDLSGNAVEMRKGMVLRFGLDRVVSIEHDDNPRQYSKEQLQRIALIFRKRARIYSKIRAL
jgi:hypothetical protein